LGLFSAYSITVDAECGFAILGCMKPQLSAVLAGAFLIAAGLTLSITTTTRAAEGAAAKSAGKTEEKKASDKITLKVVKADSEETSAENGSATNAVDGEPSTFWHTQWQDSSPAHPHEIIIELSRSCRITGFTYLPRQDDQVNGTIKDYEFYVSDDGKDFGQPVKKGTFEEGKSNKKVTFEARQCKFIKLKALSEINDEAWTSAAEITVIRE
jgi:alpha-glucosidase